MDGPGLLTAANRLQLAEWFGESEELFAFIDFSRSGGSGDWFLFTSLDRFEELLRSVDWRDSWDVILYRGTPFSIRGVADEELLERALQEIPDGHWWAIVEPDTVYPVECDCFATGDSQQELAEELRKVHGTTVWVGSIPMENGRGEHEWLKKHRDEAFFLEVPRRKGWGRGQPRRYRPIDDGAA